MPNDGLFDLGLDGMQLQIEQLTAVLDRMDERVREGVEQVTMECAQMIMREQKRMLSAADFAAPRANLAGLIKITRYKSYWGNTYTRVGYDAQAVREHPEVLVVEFGRPGTARRTGVMQEKKRRRKDGTEYTQRKGAFPPQTPHIIAGLIFAKEDVTRHFRNRLAEIARNEWNGG